MSSRILEEIRSMGFEAFKTLQRAIQSAPEDKLLIYMLSKSQKYMETTLNDDVDIDAEESESE